MVDAFRAILAACPHCAKQNLLLTILARRRAAALQPVGKAIATDADPYNDGMVKQHRLVTTFSTPLVP